MFIAYLNHSQIWGTLKTNIEATTLLIRRKENVRGFSNFSKLETL
jgi:hypothetical protein|tara:strand:+ start:1523 stop:1657 length:135 start_codon:yes stop_codon:yes gene_type:complete